MFLAAFADKITANDNSKINRYPERWVETERKAA